MYLALSCRVSSAAFSGVTPSPPVQAVVGPRRPVTGLAAGVAASLAGRGPTHVVSLEDSPAKLW